MMPKTRLRGRPPKYYTDEILTTVRKAVLDGLTIKQCAAIARVPEKQIYRIIYKLGFGTIYVSDKEREEIFARRALRGKEAA